MPDFTESVLGRPASLNSMSSVSTAAFGRPNIPCGLLPDRAYPAVCWAGVSSMKKLTMEDLKQMTPERRATLYQNAVKRREQGGQEIIDLLEASGLSLSSGHMVSDDPAYLKMIEIVWATEGRAAALAATEKGLPALAGVDPLISAELGDRYGPHDGGTLNAGYEAGQGKMPEGCVAKTAMKWKPRSN
jgi:hypothetical protein